MTGDTLVLLADGRRTPIRELVGQEPDVLAVSTEQRVVKARAEKVWRVGQREVHELKLASGRVIRCTSRHRLLTGAGWQRAGELSPGVRVALARSLPEPAHP